MVLLLWHDGKLADALCNFDRLLLQLVGVFLLLRRHRSQLSRTVLLLLLLLLHFRTLAKEVRNRSGCETERVECYWQLAMHLSSHVDLHVVRIARRECRSGT